VGRLLESASNVAVENVFILKGKKGRVALSGKTVSIGAGDNSTVPATAAGN